MQPGKVYEPQNVNPITGGEEAKPQSSTAPIDFSSKFSTSKNSSVYEEPQATPLEGYAAPIITDSNGVTSSDHLTVGYKSPLAAILVIVILMPAALLIYGHFSKVSKTQLSNAAKNDSANVLNLSAGIDKLEINRPTSINKSLTAKGEVLIQNEANSATGFQVQTSEGDKLLVADTLNRRVGIGGAPTGAASLQVVGDLSINGSLVASGSGGGFSLSQAGLRIGNSLVCTAAGCVSTSTAPSTTIDTTNLAFLNKNQTISGDNNFTNAANSFSGAYTGNGAGLSNVNAFTLQGQNANYFTNASNINSGTLADGRLSGNVALHTSANTYTATNSFRGDSANLFQIQNSTGAVNLLVADTVNGRLAVNQATANYALDVNGDMNITGVYRINGSQISSANLSNDTAITKQGNSFNGASQLVQNNASGDLPALSAINLTNLNASAASAGTLNDLRLSPNVTLQGNTFNGASQLMQTTALGYIPALNGSLITNLNASAIATGTISDTRLSTNVALLGAASQTFSGANTFSSIITAPGLETVNNTHTIVQGFSAGVATGNITYNFDVTAPPGTYTICTSVGNCAGAGGGVTTTGGTLNKVVKFSGAQTIVDSIITDNGTTVSVGGTLAATAVTQGGNTVCDVSGNCAGVGGQVGTFGTPTAGTIAMFHGSATVENSILTQAAGTVTAGGNLNVTGNYQVGGVQVTSAILSNDSNLAKLNGSGPQVFTGNNKFTGTLLAQNVANSVAAFQIQNALGTSNLLVADTTDSRIAVNQASASYALDVAGDINSTTGLRVGGTLICSTSGCTAASGSGNYIQNTTAQKTGNFNITSNGAANVTAVIAGAAGQSVDVLDVQDSAGTTKYLSINSSGNAVLSGNVGIGTASFNDATEKVRILGTADTKLTIETSGANYSGIRIKNPTRSWVTQVESGTGLYRVVDESASTVPFQIQAAAPSNSIFVQATTGNVGIGLSSIGSRLQVKGISSGSAFSVQHPGNSNSLLDISESGGNGILSMYRSGAQQDVQIATGALNSWFGAGGGNVGIGISSPGAILQVGTNTGGINNNGLYVYASPNSSYTLLKARTEYSDGAVGSGALLDIQNFSGSALYIDNSRNIGIDTNNPGNKLTVIASGASQGIDVIPNGFASGGTMRIVNPGVDNTLQIGAVENNSLQLLTANSPRVTIDTSGNVTLNSGYLYASSSYVQSGTGLYVANVALTPGSSSTYLVQTGASSTQTGTLYKLSTGDLTGYVYGSTAGIGILDGSSNWAIQVSNAVNSYNTQIDFYASTNGAGVGRADVITINTNGLTINSGYLITSSSSMYSSSLPASPVNGQEVYYVADATNQVIWHLRYNSSAATYHWEYLGGVPMSAQDTTSYTNATTTITAINPTLTVPRNGKYIVTLTGGIGMNSSGCGGANGSIYVLSNGVTLDANLLLQNNVGQSEVTMNSETTSAIETLSASVVLRPGTQDSNNCGIVSTNQRILSITPVAIN